MPAMNFDSIAETLAVAQKHAWDSSAPGMARDAEQRCEVVDFIATGLANRFESTNPRFNRVRFFLAADSNDLGAQP